MPRLLSGRVGVTSFAGLSTSRNQYTNGAQKSFLSLAEAEPNLGLSPNNDYVLYGDADGTRRWGAITPQGAVDGITVQDEGVTPVGFAGSITIMNFQGVGVTAIQSKMVQGSATVGIATIIVDPTDDIGIGTNIPGAEGIIEYLNTNVGLSNTITLDQANMPNAMRAWTIYPELDINPGAELIIGDGKVFTVDILNLESL